MQWERLRAERDEEELRDCTFAPAVNPSAEPRTPLHRRLSELQRQRRCAPHAGTCRHHPTLTPELNIPHSQDTVYFLSDMHAIGDSFRAI